MTYDPVNNPKHYADASVTVTFEPIELCCLYPFCLGNAMKYILRAPFKGHEAEDLKKAVWYLKYSMENRFKREDGSATPCSWNRHQNYAVEQFALQNKFIGMLMVRPGTGEITPLTIKTCIAALEDRIKELEETEAALSEDLAVFNKPWDPKTGQLKQREAAIQEAIGHGDATPEDLQELETMDRLRRAREVRNAH